MAHRKTLGILALLVGLSLSGDCLAESAFAQQAKQQEKQKKEEEKKKAQQAKEAEKQKKQKEKDAAQQKKQQDKQTKAEEKKNKNAPRKDPNSLCMKGCQKKREAGTGDLKKDLAKYDQCTKGCP